MSKVIKASHYIPLDDKKLIRVTSPEPALDSAPSPGSQEVGEAEAECLSEEQAALLEAKEQMIRDAEEYAESVVHQANLDAERMRDEARGEIEAWWQSRREEDERLIESATEQGREIGFRQGVEQAEAQVRREYEQMLGEAQAIIESAVQIKHRMIQESEPFLIELSCSIAEKIIGRQMTLEPSWSIDLIKSVLQRRREQGIITLCVSPDQFHFVQDAREELMLAVDSQAELQIIPDPTVRDHGCVIRSSFGSIDARIDTQLEEIKKGLQQVALRSEGAPDDE